MTLLYSRDVVSAHIKAYRTTLSQERPWLMFLSKLRRGTTGLLLFFTLFAAFFMTVYILEPVDDLSESNFGVQEWIEDYVRFDRLNGDDGKIKQVESLDDIVYFTRALVQDLLKDHDYAGTLPYSQRKHPHVLSVNRLVNSILFVQQKSLALTDCNESASSSAESGCRKLGEADRQTIWSYDPLWQAYAAELPLNVTDANRIMHELMAARWWDEHSRTFIIFFAFHNDIGDFTGTCEIRFRLSPFGQVQEDIFATFLRLNVSWPVSTCLMFTLGFLILMSLILLFANAAGQPHIRWTIAELSRAWVLVECTAYCGILCTGFLWMRYARDPYRRSVDLNSERYQHLMLLAREWQGIFVCAGMSLLCLTVRSIEFLSHLGSPMRFYTTVLSRAFENASWFILVFLTTFVGFSISANVLFGGQIEQFSSLELSMVEIAKWWVTLTDPPPTMFRQIGGGIYFILFVVIMMILVFNMFVMIVISSAESVKREEELRACRKPLALAVADKIADFMGIGKFEADPYNSASLYDESTPLSESPSYDKKSGHWSARGA